MALYTMGAIAIFQACPVFVEPSELKGPRILIASTAMLAAAIIPTWGIHQQQRRQEAFRTCVMSWSGEFACGRMSLPAMSERNGCGES